VLPNADIQKMFAELEAENAKLRKALEEILWLQSTNGLVRHYVKEALGYDA
jgi:hypothetical protein